MKHLHTFSYDMQLADSAGGVLKVTQFHYTAWPDHGVPDNVMSIISFIRHVRKLFPTSMDHAQPVLVHCSAGIGRSGTFITLDMMMQQMKDKSTLGVCRCVRYLRTQRMKMVQYGGAGNDISVRMFTLHQCECFTLQNCAAAKLRRLYFSMRMRMLRALRACSQSLGAFVAAI